MSLLPQRSGAESRMQPNVPAAWKAPDPRGSAGSIAKASGDAAYEGSYWKDVETAPLLRLKRAVPTGDASRPSSQTSTEGTIFSTS